jgi:hypothetical protein
VIAAEPVHPGEVDPHNDVLPALREYLSIHSQDATNDVADIAGTLYNLNVLTRQPLEAEVEAALEALTIEGEALP